MEASDLNSRQANELHNRIRPMLQYLAALERRMEERQFYGDDRLYLEVKTARNAVQLLVKDLHRLSCGPSHGGKNDQSSG